MLGRLFLLCLPLLCVLSRSAHAQHYHFRNISNKEGLPGNFIYRVFEDSKGYLWYLSDKGIARFDGIEYRHFSPADGYEEVAAFHIAEAPDGTIWIVTNDFKLYYFKEGKFTVIQIKEHIAWIDFDSEGRVWALGRDNSILQIRMNTPPVVVKASNYHEAANGSYTLACIGKNRFLMGCIRGLFLSRPGRKDSLLIASAIGVGILTRMLKKSNGHIIITNEKGIYDIDPETLQIVFCMPFLASKGEEMLNAFEDPLTKDVWLGSRRGVYHFPSGMISRKNLRVYLPEKMILSILRTSDKNYYIGTQNDGVFICNFNARHISSEEGLPDINISYVDQENGNRYAFTDLGKIFKLEDIGHGKIKVSEFAEKRNIATVSNYRDSILIVLAEGKYYSIIRGNIKEIGYKSIYQHYSAKRLDIDPSLVPCLLTPDTTGNVLTNEYKNIRFNKTVEDERYSGVFHPSISIHQNREFMQGGNQRLVSIKLDMKKSDTRIYPIRDEVVDLEIAENGMLYTATSNKGIAWFDGIHVKYFTTRDGLVSDYCKKIYNHNGCLWLCTNKGLSRIKLGKKGDIQEVNNFTAGDYLINDEVNNLCFDGGKVYVATGKGISIFDEHENIPGKQPLIFIERIQINNRDTGFATFYELPYDQNNINIRYKSPALRSATRILYKYLMSGEVSDTGFTYFPDVKYGSLDPGNYTFMIWARNIDGLWSKDAAILNLRIKSPLWKTWWFILGIAGSVIGIIAYVVYNRFQLLRNRTLFKTKISESELKVLRLQMNPEFIFDTLSSLQKFTLANRPLDANKYIARFSRMMRCSMDYADKPYISLQDELAFARNYIDLEQLRFERKFELHLTTDPTIISDEMLIPPLILQPFLESTIKFAISIDAPIIKLEFEKKATYLEVVITTRMHEPVNDEERTILPGGFSKGVLLTEERLRLLLENEKIDAPVTASERYSEGKPTGISYRAIIPYYND